MHVHSLIHFLNPSLQKMKCIIMKCLATHILFCVVLFWQFFILFIVFIQLHSKNHSHTIIEINWFFRELKKYLSYAKCITHKVRHFLFDIHTESNERKNTSSYIFFCCRVLHFPHISYFIYWKE